MKYKKLIVPRENLMIKSDLIIGLIVKILRQKKFWIAIFLILSTGTSIASAQTVTISGVISLPDSDAAPAGGKEFQISAQSGQDYFEFDVITISAGNNSVAYSIEVDDDPEASWSIYLDCRNCTLSDGYFPRPANYSNAVAGGATDRSDIQTLLPGGSNHTNIDMTVLRGISIQGIVSLPNAEVAPAGGIELTLWSQRSDSLGAGGWFVTIAEGQNSASYLVMAATSSVDTRVYYSCSSCASYLNRGYYGAVSTVAFEADAQTLDNSVNHTDIDIELLEGNVLSGTISLPNSDIANNGGIANWILLGLYDSSEQLIGQYSS